MYRRGERIGEVRAGGGAPAQVKNVDAMLKVIDASDKRAVARLLTSGHTSDRGFERRVAAIVAKVRADGDRALVRFARRFDGVEPPLEISRDEMRREAAKAPAELRRAIRQAARNIARVAARQIPREWTLAVQPGVKVSQRVEPLSRVGCYVPGGRFPLPSSLLMTAIPARVAGVREIIAVCPRPEPAVMAAALEAGVSRLFRMGGAHAIAALAYGTASVPRVDKIVGPGNRWVAAAKAMITADCAIDFYAGPTEIVVVSGSGRPEWIAADLVAQAEHDPDARSIFITWRRSLASRVAARVARLAAGRDVVTQSLAAHGAIVLVGDAEEAADLVNRIAPEHLVVDDERMARRRLVAGASNRRYSVFFFFFFFLCMFTSTYT